MTDLSENNQAMGLGELKHYEPFNVDHSFLFHSGSQHPLFAITAKMLTSWTKVRLETSITFELGKHFHDKLKMLCWRFALPGGQKFLAQSGCPMAGRTKGRRVQAWASRPDERQSCSLSQNHRSREVKRDREVLSTVYQRDHFSVVAHNEERLIPQMHALFLSHNSLASKMFFHWL